MDTPDTIHAFWFGPAADTDDDIDIVPGGKFRGIVHPGARGPCPRPQTGVGHAEASFLEKALGGFLNPRDVAFAEHGKGQWKTLHRHP